MATIKIQQIKSRIGAPKNQKRTLDTLGLRKIRQIVEGTVNGINGHIPLRRENLKGKNRAFLRVGGRHGEVSFRFFSFLRLA